MNLVGNDKLKLKKTVFSIYETNRGSKNKTYTYIGYYQKYTEEEMKTAKGYGREYKMKPIVIPYKETKIMKGG